MNDDDKLVALMTWLEQRPELAGYELYFAMVKSAVIGFGGERAMPLMRAIADQVHAIDRGEVAA